MNKELYAYIENKANEYKKNNQIEKSQLIKAIDAIYKKIENIMTLDIKILAIYQDQVKIDIKILNLGLGEYNKELLLDL